MFSHIMIGSNDITTVCRAHDVQRSAKRTSEGR
jgi:hypothetical protein